MKIRSHRVPLLQTLGDLPRSEAPRDQKLLSKGTLTVESWCEALPHLLREAKAGRLDALILDLDNVLMRPKGFIGSETQEHASATRHPRDVVLARRDQDERRMIAHGFFETAAGLTPSELPMLEELSQLGVRLVGATARPAKLERRTKRVLDLIGVPELDSLLFTGGSGAKKAEAVTAYLTREGLAPGQAAAIDDQRDNTDALKEAGLSTILLSHPDPNHATLRAHHYLERAARSEGGERFENLVNAYALTEPEQRIEILDEAAALLSRQQHLRFTEAVEGLNAIVGPETTRPVPTAEEQAFADRARGPLFGLAELSGFDATSYRGRAGDERALVAAAGNVDAAVEAAAAAIVLHDGKPGTPDVIDVGRHRIDPAGFVFANADRVGERVRELITKRRTTDRHELLDALEANPELSLEEIRRCAGKPHWKQDYVASLALPRTRAIDRMGPEPNLLLAAHMALSLMRGKSDREVCEQFDLSSAQLQALRSAYAFVPKEGAISLDALPDDVRDRLLALESIPFTSKIFSEWHTLSQLNPVLEGNAMVSVDHALADKFAFYRHLIEVEGAKGEEIHVVWKPHSADPIVVDLANRCLGLDAVVARDDADLEQRAKGAVKAVESGRLFVHLTGVKAWHWLDEHAAAHPDLDVRGVSHTTSDADELRKITLEHVHASIMADSDAKIRYERFMFSQSFERMLEALPARFRDDIPDLEDRHYVVHGAAGKIMGSGVVDAMLSAQRNAADAEGPFPSVTLIDPAFANPDQKERCAELEAAGFRVIAGTEIPDELMSDRMVSINCTAGDVWTKEDYDRVRADDLVFLNLGTGQKGCAIDHVADVSSSRTRFGPEGHQGSYRYQMGDLTLHNLSDGYPYNLSTRTPNPPFYSDFNNLLITMSLHDAANRDEPGARVLDMANVSFTWNEAERRPVVFLLPPDLPDGFQWPIAYDGIYFNQQDESDSRSPVLFEDLTASTNVARFLTGLAEKETAYPGTIARFFSSKRDAVEANSFEKHFFSVGPSKTVEVHDLPVRLLGPKCVLETRPKSDVAGDIFSFRFEGEPPEMEVEAPFGLVVDKTMEGISLALLPSLEHGSQPRTLRLLDAKTKEQLLHLTLPVAPHQEEEKVDVEALLARPVKRSFTLASTRERLNHRLSPGDTVKFTLPETEGHRWVPDCVEQEGAFRHDNYYQLLDKKTVRSSTRGAPAMCEMTFLVRPDTRIYGDEAFAALSILRYREGETHEEWSRRRGGSGADVTLSVVIEAPKDGSPPG